MNPARLAALLVALVATAPVVLAQPADPNADVAPALRAPVAAYRSGDLRTAETMLRALSPKDADAEAWLTRVWMANGGARLLQLCFGVRQAGRYWR